MADQRPDDHPRPALLSRPDDSLVGHRFPGAVVELPAHVSWLWSDCVGVEPDPALVHPSAAYLLGLRGTGLDVAEILALFGSRPEDGPLLGECELAFHGQLLPGHSYAGGGEVVAIERKRGSRAGRFDLVSFAVSLSDRGRAVVACRFSWVIPRREG